MDIFLIILAATYSTFTILGISFSRDIKQGICQAVGRQVKWGAFVPENAVQWCVFHRAQAFLNALFGWWVTGLSALNKDLERVLVVSYLDQVRQYNPDFTEEEDKALTLYLGKKFIGDLPAP